MYCVLCVDLHWNWICYQEFYSQSIFALRLALFYIPSGKIPVCNWCGVEITYFNKISKEKKMDSREEKAEVRKFVRRLSIRLCLNGHVCWARFLSLEPFRIADLPCKRMVEPHQMVTTTTLTSHLHPYTYAHAHTLLSHRKKRDRNEGTRMLEMERSIHSRGKLSVYEL